MKTALSVLSNTVCTALIVAVVVGLGLFLFGEPTREVDRRASDAVAVVSVRKIEVAATRLPDSPVPSQRNFAKAFHAPEVARPSDAAVEVVPVEPPDTPDDSRAIRGNEDRTGPPYGPNEGIGGISDASIFGPAPTVAGS